LLPDEDPATITFSDASIKEEWADASDITTSRILDTAWTTNDEIGIYMLPAAVTDLANNDVWANRKHKIDAYSKLNPDGETNALYYPLNKTGVRFVAYYPYASSVSSTHKLTFDFTDQSSKEYKESKDFCFHRGTTTYTTGAPAINFKHKFCKIRMNISGGTSAIHCNDIQAFLYNMPTSATVDLNKLAANTTGENAVANLGIDTIAGMIKAYTSSSNAIEATVEAIVAPHSGTGNFADRKFVFIASGDEKVYDLPDNITFEAGKIYTFNFTLIAGKSLSDGMTNCYIVPPGTHAFSFPVRRAYTVENNALTNTLHVDASAPYTGEFDAAVVWDDAGVINGKPTVLGKGNSATVIINTTSVFGNAVIKICKKGETTPVWSFHIWVTKYDPNQNTFINTDKDGKHKFVFMDRNIGATSTGNTLSARGLYYQWGRKDPFPGAKAGAAGYSELNKFYFGLKRKVPGFTNARAIIESIKNPTTFYSFQLPSNDWLHRNDNKLWGYVGPKTIYDPCPEGWRVPVNVTLSKDTSPWYGLSAKKITNGDTAAADWSSPSGSNNAVFTAGGYRNHILGTISYEGRYGYYWSASPINTNSNYSMLMTFSDNSIDLFDYDYRGIGASVRCVRE
jgi:uncharacterized protein (TIGR02145 family)